MSCFVRRGGSFDSTFSDGAWERNLKKLDRIECRRSSLWTRAKEHICRFYARDRQAEHNAVSEIKEERSRANILPPPSIAKVVEKVDDFDKNGRSSGEWWTIEKAKTT